MALRLPQSPRRRRRLMYAGAAVGVLAVLAVANAVIGNGAGPGHGTLRDEPAQVWREPRTVKPTAAEKTAAQRTLATFVRSAVIRRNLAESWPLATPHMKEGTSHSDWLHGNLPVVPYPAAEYRTSSARLTYSYRHVLGYDVLVLPKEADGQQQVYTCELHELGGRWLVDFCYPRKTL